jgi:iron complex transport system ATP-binding protein
MGAQPIIQTNGLSIGYLQRRNRNILFENLNLSLSAGELVCFMGPNGVGKSSLIRTVAGIQPPIAGKISIPPDQSIAVVLTDKISAAQMTVYDLVSYGRYPFINWRVSLSRHDYKIIKECIQKIGIEHLSNKRLFELSDGQLQMAMIAKALAQRTSMLLLDEPTAHLDLNNRVEIMNLLRHLARSENKAILVATHELDLALQTADRIWLATQQQTIVEGIPEDLVLDGSFDRVFQLKGFDLKTGRMAHLPYRNRFVQLSGEGHEYLWTKNALERDGYTVSNESNVKISIEHLGDVCEWHVQTDSFKRSCKNLFDLLHALKELPE